jgi:hypothetical protein
MSLRPPVRVHTTVKDSNIEGRTYSDHSSPRWEEGESELGSDGDDESDESGNERQLTRMRQTGRVEDTSDSDSGSEGSDEESVTPPYTAPERPVPRITLRSGTIKSPRKDGGASSSAEKGDLDHVVDVSNGHADDHPASRDEDSATPPGSPLRSFITPAARAAAPAARIPARNTTSRAVPSTTSQHAKSRHNHRSKQSAPGGIANPSSGYQPCAKHTGSRSKSNAAVQSSTKMPGVGGEDVEMASDSGDEEGHRNGLGSEHDEEAEGTNDIDDTDDITDPVASGSRPAATAMSSRTRTATGIKGQRVMKLPVRHTKKVKDMSNEKDLRHSIAGSTPVTAGVAEDVEAKDPKAEVAYEYAAVSQVCFKDRRQTG